MYDGALKLPLPSSTNIVGFADDVALVVVAKKVAAVETAANCAIRAMALSGGLRAVLTQNRSGTDIKQKSSGVGAYPDRRNNDIILACLKVPGSHAGHRPLLPYF